jgi:hypothetical protein
MIHRLILLNSKSSAAVLSTSDHLHSIQFVLITRPYITTLTAIKSDLHIKTMSTFQRTTNGDSTEMHIYIHFTVPECSL